MQIDKDISTKISKLTSDDNKMLVLNGRYYCKLTASSNALDVPPHYCFFSEGWKEGNCPTTTQYADCFVQDINLGKDHHKMQYAKIYHQVHNDLNGMDAFRLLFSDGTSVNVVDAEIIDNVDVEIMAMS